MYIRKHISCFVVTCVAQDISKCGSDVGGVLSSGLSREYTSLDRNTILLPFSSPPHVGADLLLKDQRWAG